MEELMVTKTTRAGTFVSVGDVTINFTQQQTEDLAEQLIDTIRVKYEIHADDQHSQGVITLPAWTQGDPKTAVALYFFGYASAAQFVTRAEVV